MCRLEGSRVQSVVSELGNERIDIVEWVPDTGEFIKNALSPAKVIMFGLMKKKKLPTQLYPTINFR